MTKIQLPWVELCREGRSSARRRDTSLETMRFRLSWSVASRGGDRPSKIISASVTGDKENTAQGAWGCLVLGCQGGLSEQRVWTEP